MIRLYSANASRFYYPLLNYEAFTSKNIVFTR